MALADVETDLQRVRALFEAPQPDSRRGDARQRPLPPWAERVAVQAEAEAAARAAGVQYQRRGADAPGDNKCIGVAQVTLRHCALHGQGLAGERVGVVCRLHGVVPEELPVGLREVQHSCCAAGAKHGRPVQTEQVGLQAGEPPIAPGRASRDPGGVTARARAGHETEQTATPSGHEPRGAVTPGGRLAVDEHGRPEPPGVGSRRG